jgi:hypothetical protein
MNAQQEKPALLVGGHRARLVTRHELWAQPIDILDVDCEACGKWVEVTVHHGQKLDADLKARVDDNLTKRFGNCPGHEGR